MTSNKLKTIRKVSVTILVLLILLVLVGMAYVLIADRSKVKNNVVATATVDNQTSPITPVQPSPNAPEGVALESVTSPVNVGQNSSITINTNAGSICTIVVTYNGIESSDSGLAPKNANAYGTVTWTWTIGNSVPAGKWPIKVTCTYHGRSGVYLSSVQVVK